MPSSPPYFEGDSHAAFTGQLVTLLMQQSRSPNNKDLLVPIGLVMMVDDDKGNHKNVIDVVAGSRLFRLVIADITDA